MGTAGVGGGEVEETQGSQAPAMLLTFHLRSIFMP